MKHLLTERKKERKKEQERQEVSFRKKSEGQIVKKRLTRDDIHLPFQLRGGERD
jgi:hypothetical protein